MASKRRNLLPGRAAATTSPPPLIDIWLARSLNVFCHFSRLRFLATGTKGGLKLLANEADLGGGKTLKERSWLPDPTSHTLMRSLLADVRARPSELKATAITARAWPLSTCSERPVATSQTLTVVSPPTPPT